MQMQSTLSECPKCQSDLTQYMALPTPPSFCLQCKFPLMLVAGKYRLLSVLGEGGFGTVYLAKHVRLERNAERVVKLIKPEIFKVEGMERRFYREVQLTSDLSQRNEHIVRIYDDFGEEKNLGHYYVMEYLQGRSLLDYVDKPKTPPRLAWSLAIFKQLCDAMQAAHEEGIIHRDLKPENILLIKRRKHPYFVKVLDFGIAKPMEADADSTKLTQGALGTPYYMSPEQTVNRPIDARSDQYSMSIMLYEMLAGRHPFIPEERQYNMSAMELMSAHMMQELPDPCALVPERRIPAGVGKAILRAGAKRPEDRFDSVDAFWRALERAAGALARVAPDELPNLLPPELRKTPVEEVRTAPSAFAKTSYPDELNPGGLSQLNGPRATPSIAIHQTPPQSMQSSTPAPASTPINTPLSEGTKPMPMVSGAPSIGLPSGQLQGRPQGSHRARGPIPMATSKTTNPKKRRNPILWGLLLGLALGGLGIYMYSEGIFDSDPDAVYKVGVKGQQPSLDGVVPPRRSSLYLKPRRTPKAPVPDIGSAPIDPSKIKLPSPGLVRAVPDQPPKRRVVAPKPRVAPRKRPKVRKKRKRRVRRVHRKRSLCPKADWVKLRIKPCSHGSGGVKVVGRGVPTTRGKSACVPRGSKVSIEQSRCAACIFVVPKKRSMTLILKNADEVEIDTGQTCLK